MKCKVTCCKDCPFFATIPVLAALSKILGAGMEVEKIGACNYNVETESNVVVEIGAPKGPEREAMLARATKRLAIFDNNTMPEKCPLRQGDITVTIVAKEN